jgi:hypothetical protein
MSPLSTSVVEKQQQHNDVAWLTESFSAKVVFEIARIRDLKALKFAISIARFAVLFTAWSRTEPFWMAWDSDDRSLIRLKATADTIQYEPEFLEKKRRVLGEEVFKRGHLGIPLGRQASPFIWETYESARQVQTRLAPPGPWDSRPKCARAGSCTVAPPGQTMISGYPAPAHVGGTTARRPPQKLVGNLDVSILHDCTTKVPGGRS